MSGPIVRTVNIPTDEEKAFLDLIDTTDANAAVVNETLIFDGSKYVAAPAGTNFAFAISSFSEVNSTTQLIGTGVWKAAGALSFSAAYTNGPPTAASIALTSTGGVSWPSPLSLVAPFTAGVSAAGTNYPNARDTTITFTLTATKGGSSPTSARVVAFRNNIKYGTTSTVGPWTSANINALTGTTLSNVHIGSFSVPTGPGLYLLFAFPLAYGVPNGFLYNGIVCPTSAPGIVSVTNANGYTEDYLAIRSTYANPTGMAAPGSTGTYTLTTQAPGAVIDPIYWGTSTTASGWTSNLVKAFPSYAVSNTKGRSFTVNAGVNDYIVYALPTRLGTVTFWVGGFEGGFQPPTTVAVTNNNGYTENYYVYRSDNKNLGSTTVTVV